MNSLRTIINEWVSNIVTQHMVLYLEAWTLVNSLTYYLFTKHIIDRIVKYIKKLFMQIRYNVGYY